MIDVTTANVYDSKGAGHLINSIRTYYPTIALVKADKGYVGAEHNHENFSLECVKSNFGTSEFIPLEVIGSWKGSIHGWTTIEDYAVIMNITSRPQRLWHISLAS